MSTVVNGQVVKVPNSARKTFSTACKEYFAVWFDQFDGTGDACYMFTETDLKANHHVEVQGLELTRGRLYPVMQGKRTFYLVEVEKGGVVYQYKLSAFYVARAKGRADKNPEDCTRRSLWAKWTS